MDFVPIKRALLQATPRTLREPLRAVAGNRRPWDEGPRLPPPKCPEGMVVVPPDFVGVGVQKAGTSWWYRLIVRHPHVFHAPGVHKERHYFKTFYEEPFDQRHVKEYHQWFPRPKQMLSGEWTPTYMAQFWTPSLLREAAPDTKILVMLRDPIERYRSRAAQEAGSENARHHRIGMDAYFRGLYVHQLQNIYRYFPSEKVLILQYEQCSQEPEYELKKTYGFLGLDQSVMPDGLTQVVNPTRGGKGELDKHLRSELVALYEEEVRRLQALVPSIDLSLWPNFRYLAA